jgi:hypothetical protein
LASKHQSYDHAENLIEKVDEEHGHHHHHHHHNHEHGHEGDEHHHHPEPTFEERLKA